MKRILPGLLLCSLVCISCASAAVTNGNFTGHTGSYIAHNWTKYGSPLNYEYYSGSYHSSPGSWFIVAANYTGIGEGGVSQSVDLTNAAKLSFWLFGVQYSDVNVVVYIDGVRIYSTPAGGGFDWTNYTSTNITGYTGSHTLTICSKDASTTRGYAGIFLDDVSISYNVIPLSITSHSPSSNPSSLVNANQLFQVGTNAKSNVVWKINGTTQETDSSTYNASFTGNELVAGSYNVSAIATNGTNSVSYVWLWSVSTPSSNSENQTSGITDLVEAFSVIVPSVGNMFIVIVPTVIVLSMVVFITGFWNNLLDALKDIVYRYLR